MEAQTEGANASRRNRLGLIIGLVCMVFALGVALLAYRMVHVLRYIAGFDKNMFLLQNALFRYHDEYHALPPDLKTLVERGLVPRSACRVPGSEWERPDEPSGPEVFYLPVEHWDGKTGYVIGLQPATKRVGRMYIVAGQHQARSAMPSELEGILARDDELRASTSQPSRWSKVPWRGPDSEQKGR